MTDTTTWNCTRCSTANDPDAAACTGCLTPRPELLSLPALGAFIAAKLREHFPAETECERQILALAEEAGEFVGAYRRATGMARRTGTWQDVRDELADVAITIYVTAHVMGLELPADMDMRPEYAATTGDPDRDRHNAVLEVHAAAGWFARAHQLDPATLRAVAIATDHAAHVLDIDLPAAVQSKAARILTRGWRDQPTAPSAGTAPTGPAPDDPDAQQWAEAMLDVADALTYVLETSKHDTTRFLRAYHVLFGPPEMEDDEDDEDDVPACRVCGCTDDAACPGGCHWVPDPTLTSELCSRCVPQFVTLTAPTCKPGDVLADAAHGQDVRGVVVVDDPRRVVIDDAYAATIPVHEIIPTLTVADLAGGQKLTLVQLTPRGPVTIEAAGRYSCADGWTVTGHRPPTVVLGPQAEHVMALAAAMRSAPTHGPIAQRYDDLRASTSIAHLNAAADALKAAGADAHWWGSQTSCADAGELVALAARDLIGTVPGWTTDAYQALMTPWVTTHGASAWPHPHDHTSDRPGQTRPVDTTEATR